MGVFFFGSFLVWVLMLLYFRNDIAGFQNRLGVSMFFFKVWTLYIFISRYRDFLLHACVVRVRMFVESRLVRQRTDIIHAGKVTLYLVRNTFLTTNRVFFFFLERTGITPPSPTSHPR